MNIVSPFICFSIHVWCSCSVRFFSVWDKELWCNPTESTAVSHNALWRAAFKTLPMNLRPTTPMWPRWSCALHLICPGKCISTTSVRVKEKNKKHFEVWILHITVILFLHQPLVKENDQKARLFFIHLPTLITFISQRKKTSFSSSYSETHWILAEAPTFKHERSAERRYLAGRGLVGGLQLLWQLAGAVAGCDRNTETQQMKFFIEFTDHFSWQCAVKAVYGW